MGWMSWCSPAFNTRGCNRLRRVLTLGRKLEAPRGVRLRRGAGAVGTIFVKFGQVLSTRSDLLPPDVAQELAELQDRVPPFRFADCRRHD